MTQLDAGTAFGPYTIEGFIAAGGMGEVYAARHTVYGSPVAVKVLHASLHADASWRLRFNEEGLVGQQLKHPNVLAARELVETRGRVALVMDLARGGQTLFRVMAREYPVGLPLVPALQVFLGILQGVDYAHEKGIVHGDLKPENVLLQGELRDPSRWVPLVTDFGTVGLIAHPVMLEGQPAVVASPRYASPEHLRGVAHLQPRSDVHGLGLLLHFLLTGRHASDARTVVEAAEWLREPVPLVFMVDQPVSVHVLVQRATQARPDDRFASCRDMALAVRTVLDELGVKLELEDLRSELATEVMEERARMKREAAERHRADDAAEAETELDGADSDVGAIPVDLGSLAASGTASPGFEPESPERPVEPLPPEPATAMEPPDDAPEPLATRAEDRVSNMVVAVVAWAGIAVAAIVLLSVVVYLAAG